LRLGRRITSTRSGGGSAILALAPLPPSPRHTRSRPPISRACQTDRTHTVGRSGGRPCASHARHKSGMPLRQRARRRTGSTRRVQE
jgi:hypothetical protein